MAIALILLVAALPWRPGADPAFSVEVASRGRPQPRQTAKPS
jgi:hypothetical protein